MTPKGIHSRGYLPHWDFAKSVQAITFRLDDSLPATVVKEWKTELRDLLEFPDSSPKAKAELHRRISRYEDSGIGSCVLGTSEVAQIVQAEIISGHPMNYKLIEWCINAEPCACADPAHARIIPWHHCEKLEGDYSGKDQPNVESHRTSLDGRLP